MSSSCTAPRSLSWRKKDGRRHESPRGRQLGDVGGSWAVRYCCWTVDEAEVCKMLNMAAWRRGGRDSVADDPKSYRLLEPVWRLIVFVESKDYEDRYCRD